MKKVLIILLSIMGIATTCLVNADSGCFKGPWLEGTPTQPDDYVPPPSSANKGPDANVRTVQGSLAGEEDWQRSITVGPGAEIDLKVVGENNGDVRVNNATFKYYKTSEGEKVFDRNTNRYIANDENIDIEPGESHTDYKRNITVSTNPGEYYYYLWISYDPDIDKRNNVSRNDDPTEYFKVTVLPYELKINSGVLSSVTDLHPGDLMSLTTWSINSGADIPRDIHVGYFLSAGSGYNNPTVLGKGDIRAENFRFGVTKTETFTFSAPPNPGVWTVSALLDTDNWIPEVDKNNNWMHFTFEVKDLPPAPMAIYVTNPTASDVWRSKDIKHITWQPQNFPSPGKVTVQYSLDGGNSWRTIEANTPNDGSLYWNMCKSTTIDSSKSYLRVSSVDFPGVVGVSQKFRIDHAKGCK